MHFVSKLIRNASIQIQSPASEARNSSFHERRFTIHDYLFVVILVVHLQRFLALLLFHRIVQEHANKH